MKIGIITFWQTKDNYGQMLQNLALQQYLLSLGHSPYLIRYAHSQAKQSQIEDVVLNFLRRIKHLNFKRNKSLLFEEQAHDENRCFEQFKSENLNVSERVYYSLRELKKNPPQAGVYIVGSDQVWSKFLYLKENEVFFLGFGDKKIKRIAYAPSFSVNEYPKKIQKRLQRNLNRFLAVSVREETGRMICEKVGIKAEVVLDPTMLFDSVFYKKYFDIKLSARKDIFIYSLNIKSSSDIGWSHLVKTLGGKLDNVIVTPASGYVPARELFGSSVTYKYLTIPDWVAQIANSKLLITPSFHGVVFALLFHTPFVYIPLQGNFSRGNNRVLDLLNMLDIKGHVYNRNTSYKELIDNDNIPWNKVDSILEILRSKSKRFLLNNL